mgnify:CR=1 FL=1
MKRIRSLKDKKNGQLLLLSGIIISIALIVLASISATLSTNITVPSDKVSSLKTDYDNVRREFGILLRDRLCKKLEYSDSTVQSLVDNNFDYIKEVFTFYVETLNGNSFNAINKGLLYNNEEAVAIQVILHLSDGEESISELVIYDIR